MKNIFFIVLVLTFSLCVVSSFCFAQEGMNFEDEFLDGEGVGTFPVFLQQPKEVKKSKIEKEDEDELKTISLDFKDADIRSILRIIALKSGINIVASPEVTGTVTIRLENVPWEKALGVLLDTYGFGYVKQGNIISVSPLEKLTEQKRKEQELADVQPTVSEVFKLKYIDANDAKKALEPLLSPRGKITVLEITGKAGWEFAGESFDKLTREEKDRKSLANILLVTDIPPKLDELTGVLKRIDKQPRQILIEAKIVEVSQDLLQDIGFDYGTGTVGTTVDAIGADSIDMFEAGGNVIGGLSEDPAIFNPVDTPDLTYNEAGMHLVLRKLLGSQFEVIFHALEEDVRSNVLSSPRILTLNNQEATIMVGEKYPILKTEISGGDSPQQTQSLDYYQDIGIQLNVVAQISGDNQISLIIHPAVTSFTDTVGTNEYPRIKTREAETQVVMNNGETIVIGGLVKDEENKENLGVPFLSDIPFLGVFFKRDTTDVAKIELLIFLKATIMSEKDMILTESELSYLNGEQFVGNLP